MILQLVLCRYTSKMRLGRSIQTLLLICTLLPCSCRMGSWRVFGRKIAVGKRNSIVEKEKPISQQQKMNREAAGEDHRPKRKKGYVHPESNANGAMKLAQRMTAVAMPKPQSNKKIIITLALNNAVDDQNIYSSSYSYRFNGRTKTVPLPTSTISKATPEQAMQMTVKPSDKPVNTNKVDSSYNNSFVPGFETSANPSKVSCELTTDSPIQKIELRYTYEIDFNQTTRVKIIEQKIFQSIVRNFLDCSNNSTRRQQETSTDGRKRIQGRRHLQTFLFVSLDRTPDDKIQRNETCSPIDTRSNCLVLSGALTVEINQDGEDAANKAKHEILSFIKASMDQDIYNSLETGITATRYLEPDLDTLYASFSNSISGRIKYSDSVTRTDTSPVPFPYLAHGLIGVGVLLVSLIALYSILQVKRRVALHEEASDIQYIRSGEKEINGNSSSRSEKDEDSSTNFNKAMKNNESFRSLFSGYNKFAEGDDSLAGNNTPPEVCFDHSILIPLPPKVMRREKEVKAQY